jgi:hypothetical protein
MDLIENKTKLGGAGQQGDPISPLLYIVTYPEFALLIRRVLDSMIEFNGPLQNWLQQFRNPYRTYCRLLRPVTLSATELLEPQSVTVIQPRGGLYRTHVRCLAMKIYPIVAYSLLRDVFTGLLYSNGCPLLLVVRWLERIYLAMGFPGSRA